MTASRVPVLGITMGDPAGVGPEITAKALARPEVTASCKPLVIGDRSVMEATLALLRSPLVLHAVESVDACTFEPGRLECLDLANVDVATLPKSTVSAEAGRAAYAYIETGVRLCQSGALDGIVTAPVNKEALAAAGVQHSGHTEILARLTNTKDFAMLLMGKELRVIVDARQTKDDTAYRLSKEIARALERELSYPGQIKVSVVRETRAVRFAV